MFTLYKTNNKIYEDGIHTNAKIKIIQLNFETMVLKYSGSSSYSRSNYGVNLYSPACYRIFKIRQIKKINSESFKIFCEQIGRDIPVKLEYSEHISSIFKLLDKELGE